MLCKHKQAANADPGIILDCRLFSLDTRETRMLPAALIIHRSRGGLARSNWCGPLLHNCDG
jgi:hypothetical protein